MNILVINVALRPQSPVKFFPIGLGYITTAIKYAGFDFDLLDIDANRYGDNVLEALIKKKKYDIVLMGCIVTGYHIIKQLAKFIRDIHPKAIIIAGNSVATSIPDILLSKTEVDIAVMSEGDITVVDLLKAISEEKPLEEVKGICFARKDKIIKTPPQSMIKDISTLPYIDYSIFDVEIYIEATKNGVKDPILIKREEVRALPVNTARGCIANCTFCYHVFKNHPYRYREPEQVIAEIKDLINKYSVNYIMLWDELSFFSKKQTLRFVEKILEEKLAFFWSGSCRGNLFDSEEDVEIMMKMKEAGCVSISYSLESADDMILQAMKKNVSVEQFSNQTQLFHRAGIPVGTSIVLGYPQETPETIKKTFDCCIENKIYPSSGYLLPQPGSKMYDYAKEKGLIGEEEEYLLKMGDRQDLQLNMTCMENAEFESVVHDSLMRCNALLDVGLSDDNLIKTTYYRTPLSGSASEK